MKDYKQLELKDLQFLTRIIFKIVNYDQMSREQLYKIIDALEGFKFNKFNEAIEEESTRRFLEEIQRRVNNGTFEID